VSTRTVSELVALLKDNDKDVRASAAQELGAIELGRMEAAAAASALIDALKDSHAEVRGWAADALGNIGAEAKAAVPALIDALKDMERFPINWRSDRTVSNSASGALSRIDPEAARKAGIP
jgi:HEAT repeat protein